MFSNILPLSLFPRALAMYTAALKQGSAAADVVGMQWCCKCSTYSLGNFSLWSPQNCNDPALN